MIDTAVANLTGLVNNLYDLTQTSDRQLPVKMSTNRRKRIVFRPAHFIFRPFIVCSQTTQIVYGTYYWPSQ